MRKNLKAITTIITSMVKGIEDNKRAGKALDHNSISIQQTQLAMFPFLFSSFSAWDLGREDASRREKRV